MADPITNVALAPGLEPGRTEIRPPENPAFPRLTLGLCVLYTDSFAITRPAFVSKIQANGIVNLAVLPSVHGDELTFPLPGIDAAVVDSEGKETAPGQTGYLIIRKPWPGLLLDVYGDPQRYKEAYWSRFPGSYYTGDFAMRDEDGYFWLLGRADEVLKVAGHRIGTAEG